MTFRNVPEFALKTPKLREELIGAMRGSWKTLKLGGKKD
jgi:hypothetical protein